MIDPDTLKGIGVFIGGLGVGIAPWLNRRFGKKRPNVSVRSLTAQVRAQEEKIQHLTAHIAEDAAELASARAAIRNLQYASEIRHREWLKIKKNAPKEIQIWMDTAQAPFDAQ